MNKKGTWRERLEIETLDLKDKVNALHAYMETMFFYDLTREDKDLLYAQYHAMLTYLQILGKRCELHGIKLNREEIKK